MFAISRAILLKEKPSDINLCVSFHGSGLSFETLTSSLFIVLLVTGLKD